MQLRPGRPDILGAYLLDGGARFAIATKASKLTLVLFPPGSKSPTLILLNPNINRTGEVWHVELPNIEPGTLYGYLLDHAPDQPIDPKNILADPYARRLACGHEWRKGYTHELSHLSLLSPLPPPISPLRNRPKNLIIYEMHLHGFTCASGGGGFLDLIPKITYLQELGVTAIELLPIFEFDETANPKINPVTKQSLCNYWGYNTLHYFCPMARYAKEDPVAEFQQMVQALHEAGIAIILDVVYNHTAHLAPSGQRHPFYFLAPGGYYLMDKEGNDLDFTGCGNTLNANHPLFGELVIASLRYWVAEMGVDGFRFDLASSFYRGEQGQFLADPAIMGAITEDPLLQETYLIAEPWDAAGFYQVGAFGIERAEPGRWYEWNGQFRDAVRRFWRGIQGVAGPFAAAICGSEHLYAASGRKPYHSINFVTAHDGFSLEDLVSYESKHNEANGEEGRDGTDQNESWNCGAEGPTKDPNIIALRARQSRNLLCSLFLSLGTPMLLMGDEYGHTRQGNNNPWCQDNELNWFLWERLKANPPLFRFCKLLIQLRCRCDCLRGECFLKPEVVLFHGATPGQPDWSEHSQLVALELNGQLLAYFYAGDKELAIKLPSAPNGKAWQRVIDTARPSPEEILEHPQRLDSPDYKIAPHSTLVLIPC